MRSGFTLVEIMIVTAIIAVLAMIAMPALMKVRRTSLNTCFANDINKIAAAFELYAIEHRGYPPDTFPAGLPEGISDYLQAVDLTADTPIGGQWDWDYEQFHFGCLAGISVYRPDRSVDEMREIDAKLDDGNLLTGMFRQRSQGYIYVIEF